MIRNTPYAPSRSNVWRAFSLVALLLGLVACGGDETASDTPADVPHSEEVSPEPTYEPAVEVIDPVTGESGDIDPAQLAVEQTSDDPDAPRTEPQPAKPSEPDVD